MLQTCLCLLVDLFTLVATGSALGKARGKQQAPPAKPRPRLVRLSDDMMAFFVSRGISPKVVERNGVQQEKRWSHKHERYVDMIGARRACVLWLTCC